MLTRRESILRNQAQLLRLSLLVLTFLFFLSFLLLLLLRSLCNHHRFLNILLPFYSSRDRFNKERRGSKICIEKVASETKYQSRSKLVFLVRINAIRFHGSNEILRLTPVKKETGSFNAWRDAFLSFFSSNSSSILVTTIRRLRWCWMATTRPLFFPLIFFISCA